MMNGAMAISGSGIPHIFYTMIDAMTLGGIEVGIPKKLALSLATQTMLGAAEMLKSPENLQPTCETVCSARRGPPSKVFALWNPAAFAMM